jgi:Transposase DDE domain group 1
MRTQCNAEQLEFAGVDRRRVVAAFDGGRVCSDGGALLLKRTDEAIGLLDRLAGCFVDGRQAGSVEHSVRAMLAQRIFGLALGYEDLNDHERLRTDAVFGVLAGKLDEPLAGKSTLNRLELFPRRGLSRYHRIRPDGAAIERLFVELFLDSYRVAPAEIVLDLDATDVPLHGAQERRFFHGYYDHYCYLPLYVYCGRQPLMARLRPANIDGAAGALEAVQQLVGQIRTRWAHTRIVLRADSGFAREALMGWCERHGVEYLFGLAKNARLVRAIGRELREAAGEAHRTGRPARRFRELTYRTRASWSRTRRVVAKAEQTGDKANPRFVVSSLAQRDWPARELYEDLYCARGEMENRIKEAQLDLFADRLSAHAFHVNQLRLWLATFAHVLIEALRRLALARSDLARASAQTIRLKLLKIGAVVTVSVRRIRFALSETCPHQVEFIAACRALGVAAR